MRKVISFEISKGPKYTKDFVKEETDLTADMLARYGFPLRKLDTSSLMMPQWFLEGCTAKAL